MEPTLNVSFRRIVNIVLALMVIGIFLWAVNTYVPMAQSIKDILNIFVVIATIVFILQAVGLWPAVTRLWNDLTARRLPPEPRA
jgi:undecaprenyl pyrophosphate phosphatase UppP